MHTFNTDLNTGLITIDVVGMWTPEDIAVFAQDLHREALAVASTGKRHLLFIDYTRAHIQAQVVVGALQELARTTPLKARKCALCTEGVLARLQARRIAAESSTMGVFTDRAAAMAWLQDDSVTAPPSIDAAFPAFERQTV